MKYIIAFIVLISFVFCEPPVARAIPAEEAFTELKKKILECIIKSEDASPEMKQYATDTLQSGYKGTLNLSQFRKKDSDRLAARQCRREAFTYSTKTRLFDNLPLAPKDKIKPRMDN